MLSCTLHSHYGLDRLAVTIGPNSIIFFRALSVRVAWNFGSSQGFGTKWAISNIRTQGPTTNVDSANRLKPFKISLPPRTLPVPKTLSVCFRPETSRSTILNTSEKWPDRDHCSILTHSQRSRFRVLLLFYAACIQIDRKQYCRADESTGTKLWTWYRWKMLS